MTSSLQQDYTQVLQQLMQHLGFSSYKQLSQTAGVSQKQLRRLRGGQIAQLRVETLQKLSQALQVSVNKLLETFSPEYTLPTFQTQEEELVSLEVLRQEYQHLHQQLLEQREVLSREFQQSSLQVLEPWLIQWPTAAYAAQQNQQLPAVRLLPLVRPIEQLLQAWRVEAIAPVGTEIPYDPQIHQLMEGNAQPGDTIRVRYTGYRQGDKLLYRAKVSAVKNPQSA